MLLFTVFPYVAIVVCIAGCLYRKRADSVGTSASSWLERKSPLWNWIPWHIWLLLILCGHLLAFLFPHFWSKMVYLPILLITIEAIGVTVTVVGMIGLILLLTNHLFSRRLIGIITPIDMLILLLLLVQFVFGLTTVIVYRWSASWSISTTTPYLWSLLALKPDASFIADLPFLVKSHIMTAWLFIFLLPFSNLRHVFTLPLRAIQRSTYRSIWNVEMAADQSHSEERRQFLLGIGTLAVGGAIISTGAVEKLLSYVFSVHLSQHEESKVLGTRLERLHMTVEQKQLEYERLQNDFILVAPFAELTPTTGKYFIDYEMRPALAFKGSDGFPLLISAKCTHLGCTVGNQVTKGKILCPCHVSYFDIKTGEPSAGAPAKAPLPLLGWVIRDAQGQEIMAKAADGTITGHVDPKSLQGYSVYIAKRDAAEGGA